MCRPKNKYQRIRVSELLPVVLSGLLFAWFTRCMTIASRWNCSMRFVDMCSVNEGCMINLLCTSIDHLTGVLYNEDSQMVNNLRANSRTCESLPGMNTSYLHTFFISSLYPQRWFLEIGVQQFSYVIHHI